MKTRKTIAAILAGVMACASLPLSAMGASAAETTYQPGDVDMDGYVTGHDSALVSRFLNKGDISLTKEQLILADVNNDGFISQADADQIHETEEFVIGDAGFGHLSALTAYKQASYIVLEGAGYDVAIEANMSDDVNISANITTESLTVSQVEYNLLDVDADGDVDTEDLFTTLYAAARRGAGADSVYLANGRYDLNSDMIQEDENFKPSDKESSDEYIQIAIDKAIAAKDEVAS